MDWIKQNIKLVISVLIVVVVIAGGGFWVFAQMQRSKSASEELAGVHSRWEILERQNPHPGTEEINNISEARKDFEIVHEVFEKIQREFSPVSFSVATNSFQFKTMLERSIAEMRKEAANSGVQLPPQFAFTFKDQLDKVQFPVESMSQWSEQLHDIKALSELLFSQRVHSIERMRRVAIDAEIDVSSGQFIDTAVITNEVAVLAPYEVVFKGYSGELSKVLEGIANLPIGLRVKAIKVEHTTIAGDDGAGGGVTSIADWNRLRANSIQGNQTQQTTRGGGSSEEAQMREFLRQRAEQQAAETVIRQPVTTSSSAGQNNTQKVSDVVNEKPLQVTLVLDFVKPLPNDAQSE